MDGNLPRTANELGHQLSDVPYTNAVFKLGGKTMVITIMEDTDDYYD